MKKITFLFTLLFSTSIIFSQVVLTEDFEGGLVLPAGWANTDTPGNGEIWTFETGGEAPFFTAGNTFFYDPAGMAGNYAIFNSDAYGDNGTAEESSLESPIFNCGSLTNVTLRFNHFFLSGFGSEGYVEVFDGTTWQTVIDYMEPGVPANTPEFGLVELDVSAHLAGVTNAQVRFRWVGNFSYYWAVDNVEVFQCTVSAPAPVVSPMPMDGATNVALDNTDTNFPNRLFFSWTDGPGDPGASYTLNLGVQNPPTDNTFTGFPNGDFIFNLSYDTTYFWSIESINCAGASTSAVWSFTTEADPNLSIDEFKDTLFSHYYDSESEALNLESSSSAFTNIEIYSIFGSFVIEQELSNINESIDVSALSPGTYIAKVAIDGNKQSIKFIKN